MTNSSKHLTIVFMDTVGEWLRVVATLILFMFSLAVHEAAHALVAEWLKADEVSEIDAHASFFPMNYCDWIGTIFLPIFLATFWVTYGTPLAYGWARPMSLDPSLLRAPRRDMVLIILAGPLANLFVAVFAIFLFLISRYGVGSDDHLSVMLFLRQLSLINVALAMLNLIPIPPLDGGQLVALFFPGRWSQWLGEKQRTFRLILFLMFFIFCHPYVRLVYATVSRIRDVINWIETPIITWFL